MGSYCFSIDLEGHVLDERVGETLMGLRRICAEVRFLGSYPRADRQRASIAPLTSDADFVGALVARRPGPRSLRSPSLEAITAAAPRDRLGAHDAVGVRAVQTTLSRRVGETGVGGRGTRLLPSLGPLPLPPSPSAPARSGPSGSTARGRRRARRASSTRDLAARWLIGS